MKTTPAFSSSTRNTRASYGNHSRMVPQISCVSTPMRHKKLCNALPAKPATFLPTALPLRWPRAARFLGVGQDRTLTIVALAGLSLFEVAVWVVILNP